MNLYKDYIQRLESSLDQFSWESVHHLSLSLQQAWRAENKIFLCGNGGSAGNAIHLANDFIYGVDKIGGMGLQV